MPPRSVVGQLPLALPDLGAARPILEALEQLESVERASRTRLHEVEKGRAAVLSSLFDGLHRIPDSYDRFVAYENPDSVNLEPATV